jgi:hypothetical protein
MKKDFETILDESLSRLKQKESMEACLGRYPQYAAQLEPLLRMALKVEVLKDTAPPSTQAMAAGRERFLREAARLQTERAPTHKLARDLAGRTWILPLVVVALLAGLLLLVFASLLILAVLIRLNVPDVFHRPPRQWVTPELWPTMTRVVIDTPQPTLTPYEYQTPMTTRILYPTESGTPTCTPTPRPTHTCTLQPSTPAQPTMTPTPISPDTPVSTATPMPPTDTPVPTMTPMPPTHTPHPTHDHGGCEDECDGHDDGDHDGGDHGGGHGGHH